MRRLFLSGLLILLTLGMAASCALLRAAAPPAPITVSAAISLKDALDELGRTYGAVTFNYGGSGTLARQIEQGAPVDVFFSAAEKEMDELAARELILPETRRDVVGNALVLITPAQATMVQSFQDLTRPEVKTLALGRPATVPAGMYGRQTLKYLKLFSALESKIVYAKDVRAVLTYVATGNADAGLVYQTDAMISRQVRVAARAPADSHDPVLYPAAVLQNSRNPQAARAFLEFLQGPQARAVFAKYGFTAAEKSAGNN
ncbi:MAG: molybdate ABC transporter substrate-binding protein [Candidatus Acidiferrales bacterium]